MPTLFRAAKRTQLLPQECPLISTPDDGYTGSTTANRQQAQTGQEQIFDSAAKIVDNPHKCPADHFAQPEWKLKKLASAEQVNLHR